MMGDEAGLVGILVGAAQGLEAYEQQYRDRVVKHLTRRAKELGYDLIRTSEAASA